MCRLRFNHIQSNLKKEKKEQAQKEKQFIQKLKDTEGIYPVCSILSE